MTECGQIAASVIDKVLKAAAPGVTKSELDKLATSEIKKLGGQLSFTTVPGYHWASCVTVNEEVVHGIPNDYSLTLGDLVSVDLGAVWQGYHTDCARTIYLGKPDSTEQKFVEVGSQALDLAIGEAKVGNHIGDISAVIQKQIESAAYSVVRALVGHGIGAALHEDPQIPGFVTKDLGPQLATGMTIAIEVIYTAGSPEVLLKEDGWTIVSADGSLGGLFEDTVAITKSGPVILTRKH